MNIVIVRLDLDTLDTLTIARLVRERHITFAEAETAKVIKSMSELHRLLWIRQVKSTMTDVRRSA